MTWQEKSSQASQLMLLFHLEAIYQRRQGALNAADT